MQAIFFTQGPFATQLRDSLAETNATKVKGWKSIDPPILEREFSASYLRTDNDSFPKPGDLRPRPAPPEHEGLRVPDQLLQDILGHVPRRKHTIEIVSCLFLIHTPRLDILLYMTSRYALF